jgi:hypothetical protein
VIPPDLPQHWDPMPEGAEVHEVVIYDSTDGATLQYHRGTAVEEQSSFIYNWSVLIDVAISVHDMVGSVHVGSNPTFIPYAAPTDPRKWREMLQHGIARWSDLHSKHASCVTAC